MNKGRMVYVASDDLLRHVAYVEAMRVYGSVNAAALAMEREKIISNPAFRSWMAGRKTPSSRNAWAVLRWFGVSLWIDGNIVQSPDQWTLPKLPHRK